MTDIVVKVTVKVSDKWRQKIQEHTQDYDGLLESIAADDDLLEYGSYVFSGPYDSILQVKQKLEAALENKYLVSSMRLKSDSADSRRQLNPAVENQASDFQNFGAEEERTCSTEDIGYVNNNSNESGNAISPLVPKKRRIRELKRELPNDSSSDANLGLYEGNHQALRANECPNMCDPKLLSQSNLTKRHSLQEYPSYGQTSAGDATGISGKEADLKSKGLKSRFTKALRNMLKKAQNEGKSNDALVTQRSGTSEFSQSDPDVGFLEVDEEIDIHFQLCESCARVVRKAKNQCNWFRKRQENPNTVTLYFGFRNSVDKIRYIETLAKLRDSLDVRKYSLLDNLDYKSLEEKLIGHRWRETTSFHVSDKRKTCAVVGPVGKMQEAHDWFETVAKRSGNVPVYATVL